MSENTNFSSKLEAKKTKQEQAPTLLQITTFFKHLGDVLGTFDNCWNVGGYLWLVDDEEEHKAHLGYKDQVPDPNNPGNMIANPEGWVMATIPTKPKYNSNFDRHGYHIYMLNMAYYELCYHFDKEAIEANIVW